MKVFSVVSLVALACSHPVSAAQVSPIDKVLQLLSDVQAKIVAEGAEAQKVQAEFTEYCDDRSKDLAFAIKTSENEAAELTAGIQKATATIGSMQEKIGKLASDIASNDGDIDAANKIRAKEAADFASAEKELNEIISMLERAIGILQREMAKNGAAMLQMKSVTSVTEALSVMVQASVLAAADGERLTALVQQASDARESEDAIGAPDAAVYEGHSAGIIDTLQGLLEKAEEQLADARKKETTARHNFEMLIQSLNDEIKFATRDMDGAKSDLAAAQGEKTEGEGNLAQTTKSLKADKASSADLQQVCAKTTQEYEAAVSSRTAELKALADAKRVISEMTGGADALTYGFNQVSFLQHGETGVGRTAARFVRDLAKKEGSAALAQLASRMVAVLRTAAHGEDPFAKVKGLITDMIAKLEDQMSAEATEKAYCDKELAETNTKKADKSAEIGKLTAAIDKASARSAQLKIEVGKLQDALAKLAASQAEMDRIRSEQNADYVKNKADLEQGIAGVKQALKILREYYASDGKAHAAAEGAGASVIGLLEVCESDFTKGLSETVSAEETAAADYDETSKANEIERTAREQDVKFKTKEAAGLDKAVTDTTADRAGVQDELDAVLQYLAGMEKRCIALPETYAERKRRREAELAGLREALSILGGESLIQQSSKRTLRGAQPHHY